MITNMNILDRIEQETARQYVFRVLLANIIRLNLAPGTAISENEISSELHTSRTPVREALIELRQIGLVTVLPQKGSYVSLIDYDQVEESRFIRTSLEIAVVKLMCSGITQDWDLQLNNNLALQQEALHENDADSFYTLDNQFHELLFSSVNKRHTYELVKRQSYHFDRLRSLSLRSISFEKTYQDHEDILHAVNRKDAELAEFLVSRHLHRHIFEKEALEKNYPDYFKIP